MADPTPPIYHDVEDRKFYYPKMGLEEEIPFNVVEGKPPLCLMYNNKTKTHFNPINGDQFILIDRLDHLEDLKKQLKAIKAILRIGIVYHDPDSELYYFPLSGELKDVKNRNWWRNEVPQMQYLAELDTYYDRESGREYMMVSLKPVMFKITFL